MIRFSNDYSEACHPLILEALVATNLEGNFGYSRDPHSEKAHELIRKAVACPTADVHILVGGTQTNTTVIASALRPHEAVITAATGHIVGHESGAIEATGHKCITCPAVDGKLTPALVRAAAAAHTEEYTVKPRMVYISQTTELGTLYNLPELEALSETCRELGLYLFLDGARLGSALATGLFTLPDLARLCDVFYIGGTKNGAMMGEALVIVNDALKPDFRYHLKQRGGMMAKGWLLGLQFEVLMQNDLYIQLAQHANAVALKLKDGIAALGYRFTSDSITNQQFVVLPNAVLEQLNGRFTWEVMSRPDANHTEIRLVTSWATPESAADAFVQALKEAAANT